MALRRRSYGQHHRPDWEQRLCRVDAELADGDLSPAQARERYRSIGREQADALTPDEDASERSDSSDASAPPDGGPSPDQPELFP